MCLPGGMRCSLPAFVIIGVYGAASLDVYVATGVSLQPFTRLVRGGCHEDLLVLFIVHVNGCSALDGVGNRHGFVGLG